MMPIRYILFQTRPRLFVWFGIWHLETVLAKTLLNILDWPIRSLMACRQMVYGCNFEKLSCIDTKLVYVMKVWTWSDISSFGTAPPTQAKCFDIKIVVFYHTSCELYRILEKHTFWKCVRFAQNLVYSIYRHSYWKWSQAFYWSNSSGIHS